MDSFEPLTGFIRCYATALDEKKGKSTYLPLDLVWLGCPGYINVLTGATIPAEWAIIHRSSYRIKELFLRDFKSPFSVHFLGVTCGENFSHRVKYGDGVVRFYYRVVWSAWFFNRYRP